MLQSISQLGNSSQGLVDASSTFSLDESSLDAAPLPRLRIQETNPPSVTDAMASFMHIFSGILLLFFKTYLGQKYFNI